ncbi:MAG: hypothetical protein JXB10_11870 [Pirellulales bacterium]|nr:hypothetical protein [Pirellulales bacterium]
MLLGLSGPASAQSPGGAPGDYAWQPTPVEKVKARAFAWLDEKRADPLIKTKAQELWANLPQPAAEEEILDRLVRIFALADAEAEKLVALCSRPPDSPILPPQQWLHETRTAPFAARNLRLYYARWLVQNNYFDEAQTELDGLEAGDVAAPATLLFYQSAVSLKLLDRDTGLRTLDQLLAGPPSSPRRYATVAKLMHADLQDLEEDSLDHISRRMEDIGRRMDLGRAGTKVRRLEDGVIESLDKLIKKLEEAQQQQSSSNSGNNLRPDRPAADSRYMAGKGPGRVEKKAVGDRSGWGDLPPKEREEALQQIGRDFPAHYRDVIEEYFKRLASEENP